MNGANNDLRTTGPNVSESNKTGFGRVIQAVKNFFSSILSKITGKSLENRTAESTDIKGPATPVDSEPAAPAAAFAPKPTHAEATSLSTPSGQKNTTPQNPPTPPTIPPAAINTTSSEPAAAAIPTPSVEGNEPDIRYKVVIRPFTPKALPTAPSLASAAPSSPSSQPAINPATAQALGGTGATQTLGRSGADPERSKEMCNNLREEFIAQLSNLTAGSNPLTREDIKDNFLEDRTLRGFANDTLGVTFDKFNVNSITPGDAQKLRDELLAAFDEAQAQASADNKPFDPYKAVRHSPPSTPKPISLATPPKTEAATAPVPAPATKATSQPAVNPATTQALGGAGTTQTLGRSGADPEQSEKMCNNFREAFMRELPALTTGLEALSMQTVEGHFKDNMALDFFAEKILELTDFDAGSLSHEDAQKLKDDMLAAFGEAKTQAPADDDGPGIPQQTIVRFVSPKAAPRPTAIPTPKPISLATPPKTEAATTPVLAPSTKPLAAAAANAATPKPAVTINAAASKPAIESAAIAQGGTTPSASLEHARQVLLGAVTKAYGGNLSNVSTRPQFMPLAETRRIQQTIETEIAVDCFGADGKVDVRKLRGLMELFGNAEIFKEGPYCLIPDAELVRTQIYRGSGSLLNNRNGIMDELNATNHITVGLNGQFILATMSQGREPPLTPGEAILASLLSPHRQSSTPTCAINSLINAEILDHPERLVPMYAQMLSGDQFAFPSGYAVQQQPIVDGFITVNLENGGPKGRGKVFEDIVSGEPNKIAQRMGKWHNAGIRYAGLNNEAEKYKLGLPVHNMNDMLFAHLFQASNFGNSEIDGDSVFGTMLIYAGREDAQVFSNRISVDGPNFLEGIGTLKRHAGDQKHYLGHHYMRVTTEPSSGSGHAENIDIDALLTLDPNKMENGKAYAIGDRNWDGGSMSRDIPRLAVRKMDGTPPTFEFGTLWSGSHFEKCNISKINVFTTKVSTTNNAPASPPSPSTQPAVKPATTQMIGNPEANPERSKEMCENLRNAFMEKLPELMATPEAGGEADDEADDDELFSKEIEFHFQDKKNLERFAKILGSSIDANGIIREDAQKLKNDMLEAFYGYKKS
jgi:hypothetical protein